MQCPIDNTELLITERQGIEIDYCPKCRGIWLDRGELDKLIERAAVAMPAMPAPAPAPAPDLGAGYGQAPPPPAYPGREYREQRDYRDARRERDDDDDDDYRRKRKRRSFLEDIFDFD